MHCLKLYVSLSLPLRLPWFPIHPYTVGKVMSFHHSCSGHATEIRENSREESQSESHSSHERMSHFRIELHPMMILTFPPTSPASGAGNASTIIFRVGGPCYSILRPPPRHCLANWQHSGLFWWTDGLTDLILGGTPYYLPVSHVGQRDYRTAHLLLALVSS